MEMSGYKLYPYLHSLHSQEWKAINVRGFFARSRFGVQAVGATGRSPLQVAKQHSLKAVLQTGR